MFDFYLEDLWEQGRQIFHALIELTKPFVHVWVILYLSIATKCSTRPVISWEPGIKIGSEAQALESSADFVGVLVGS